MPAQPITARLKWMFRKDPKFQVLNTTSAFPSCLPDTDFALENQWLGSGGGWVGGMIWPRSMVHSLYFCLPPLSLALEKPASAILFCILLPFYLVLKHFQVHWRIFYPQWSVLPKFIFGNKWVNKRNQTQLDPNNSEPNKLGLLSHFFAAHRALKGLMSH